MKINLLAPSALCLLLLSTLTVMSNATIAPALPGLAREFAGMPSADLLVKMLLPIPALFVVIFAPILGWTADKFGRRKQLLISTAVFALSGAAGALLSSLEAIIISRAILGICVAGLMTAITALITDYFSGAQRSQFMGLQQSFSNIGGIVFIVTAGYLANISARLPFFIYAAALLLVPLVFIAIKDTTFTNSEHEQQQANNQINPQAQTSWKWPLIGCSLVLFCHLVIFYILPTQIPFFMVDIGISDPSKSGLAMGAGTLAAAIAGISFGKLVNRIKNYGVAFLGFLAMSVGMVVLSQAATFSVVIVGCALMGVCMGLVMPNFMVTGLALVPSDKRGLASGVLTSSIFIGQFVSPLISSALISILAYSHFYLLAAGFTVVLALASSAMLRAQTV
ncbi:MFS transporter [Psychrobacter aquaticus]|uniref:Major facilitator superfamily (MFS) profile domain-containing protein n=1 Tax=Psychrobacter aquaticus CMS 56 TaxID=1354303 RepID=U4TDN7_9GAMM|nr:MFS transporter [Psychrobacter aquaticus]ERL56553.1 hypothetical protein M917_0579 [Psychrobacter aquaticus CMS 56]